MSVCFTLISPEGLDGSVDALLAGFGDAFGGVIGAGSCFRVSVETEVFALTNPRLAADSSSAVNRLSTLVFVSSAIMPKMS